MASAAALATSGLLLAISGVASADEPAVRSRHWLGLEVGGSNALQFVYRGTVTDGLVIEAGFFGAPPFLLGSLGVVLESPPWRRWSIYAGTGIGGIAAFDEGDCDAHPSPECVDRSDWVFLHARGGVQVLLGSSGRLGVDVGFWRGTRRDLGGGEVVEREAFLIPMAGLSYLRAMP